MFGLSPLFLSTVGTVFFPDAEDGLDAPQYLLFLAIFCGCINFFGAFGLHAVPKRGVNATQIVENSQPLAGNAMSAGSPGDPEMAPLLPRPSPPPRDYEKLGSLIADVDFLLLGLIMLCCMGMVCQLRLFCRVALD